MWGILNPQSSVLVFLTPQTPSLPPLPPQLSGCPQNCWLSGPTVPSHPQKRSGEGHPWSLRRRLRGRWQLRRKGGWKL